VAIEFDPRKDEENLDRHGLRLAAFDGFDADPAVIEDRRFDYGERRFRAFGRIAGRGFCVVYTIRDGNMRLISFRRAHEKEMRQHDR
jgi:uncharacterized DUF497 family protein